MPTKLINSGKFRKVLYNTPRKRRVEIEVEASAPVSLYIVAADDLDSFRSGSDFDGLGFEPTRKLLTEIRLPFASGSEWFLVIENENDAAVAVHYEVYDV